MAARSSPEPPRRRFGASWVVALGVIGVAAWYVARRTEAEPPRAPVVLPLQILAPDAGAGSIRPVAPPAATTRAGGADARDADEQAIHAELERIAKGEAESCRAPEDPAGTAYVTVKIESPGRVKYAKVGVAPFADTPSARCIESKMLAARLPGFRGDELTITQAVRLR